MKNAIRYSVFALVATVLIACGQVQPKNDQQFVYAASGQVGEAFLAANVYQALNDCTKPAHTLPCSDKATADRVQVAKEDLLKAYKEADALVNSPDYTADKFSKAKAILNAALRFLISITPKT